jgi:hypothetical protein
MLCILVTPSVSPDCVAVLEAMVSIPGVRTGLICHKPQTDVPEPLRARLAGHYKVDFVGDVTQLATALSAFQRGFGKIDRLLGFAEVLQVQLAQLRDRFRIPGVGEEVALRFRDKHRMKEVLRQHGLPVARQALIRSVADARAFVAEVGWPVVLKPLAGVGSQGTARVASVAELDAAMQSLRPSTERPLQAEAFVTGDERTFETVIVDGEPVWASQTHYLNRPLEILENPWMQWTVLFPREPLDEVAQRFLPTNVAALRALGLRTGIAHMEWFVHGDGVTISEVGARPPGARFMTMLGYSYDEDLWSRWVELEILGRWRPLPPRKYAVGCAFFRAQGPGERITSMEGLDVAQRLAGAHVMDRKLPVLGAPRSSSYEGDGWAVVRHPDTAVVKDTLRALISSVRVWAA